MPKKLKKTDWGKFFRTEEQYEAMVWCIKNNIRIGPYAASHGPASKEYYIDIIINNKVNRSPEKYHMTEVWEQIYKYYQYYYDKHRT